MSEVFSSSPGAVARIVDPTVTGVPAVVTVPGLGSLKLCVTRVTVNEMTNHQFLHTLGNFIYIYVFGDRIGQLGISGLAFHTTCGDGSEVAAVFRGQEIGLEEAMRFYRENKLSKNPNPVKVTIGLNTTFQCFLTGAHFDIVDPQNKICQFDFQFALVPEV